MKYLILIGINLIETLNFDWLIQGTRVDEAKVMIGSAGLKILPVDNLDEAARYYNQRYNIYLLIKRKGVRFDPQISQE